MPQLRHFSLVLTYSSLLLQPLFLHALVFANYPRVSAILSATAEVIFASAVSMQPTVCILG